jgi:hypothetical protein
MSFQITGNTNGLRVTGLSIPVSNWSSGMYLGLWMKAGSGYVRGLSLEGNDDGARPLARIGAYPSTRASWAFMSRAGGAQYNAYHFAADYPDGYPGGTPSANGSDWFLNWLKWVPTLNGGSGNLRTGWGDIAGSLCGDGDLDDWHTAGGGTADITTISVGCQYSYLDGTTDEFSTIDFRCAMPIIAYRLPTSGEQTSLVGGTHPLDIFTGGSLYDYWPVDSKTSGINSLVFSDVGSAVSINTNDNPTISAPTGGGGGSGTLIFLMG